MRRGLKGWLRRFFGEELFRESGRGHEPDACPPQLSVASEAGDLAAPTEVELGPELDLHLFRPAETHDLVLDFLDEAVARGWSLVRIVHGRGRGEQRRMVHKLLVRDPRVVSFSDGERGNWGATVACLSAESVPSREE